MIKAISPSNLTMALRCGEQFRRRYIENEIIPPGISLGRGIGVHKANKANLSQKIKSEKDLSLSDLKDAARDGYIHTFRNGVYLAPDDMPAKKRLLNEGLEDTLRCTGVYSESVAPQIEPVAVEKKFNVSIGLDLPLRGIMDYQDRKPVLGDLKTSVKKPKEGQIKEEIQPVFYSLVHEKETRVRPEFMLHYLIARRGKDGRPTSEDYDFQTMTATERNYSALYAHLNHFIRMLQSGIFTPCNPAVSWWCDAKYCGYWLTCEFVGNGPLRRWV